MASWRRVGRGGRCGLRRDPCWGSQWWNRHIRVSVCAPHPPPLLFICGWCPPSGCSFGRLCGLCQPSPSEVYRAFVSVLTVSLPVLVLCALPCAFACLGSPWAYNFCIQPSIARMSPVGSSVYSIPFGLFFTCFSFHSNFRVAPCDKDMILIALCFPPPPNQPLLIGVKRKPPTPWGV